MSNILSVYSMSGLKEVLLPAIDNADYELKITGRLFGFSEDYTILMEILEGEWYFVERRESYQVINTQTAAEYKREAVHDQDMYTITLNGSGQLFVIMRETDRSFVVYDKYEIPKNGQITIGSNENNDLRYQYHNLISGHPCHAVIVVDEGNCVLRDQSANGTFVNDVRISDQRKLQYGDRINIYGLKIVYMGDFLAVNTSVQDLHVKQNLLKEYQYKKADNEAALRKRRDELFHRSPRNILKLETEAIEIEAPPGIREDETAPTFMSIGPALTMSLPMLLGSAVTIAASQKTGMAFGAFMFTGIITALGSAIIGVFWSLKNMKYQKGKKRADELRRFDKYGQYLTECSDKIKTKYVNNTRAMLEMYRDAETVCGYDRNSVELWNRNARHEDFLRHRLGLGRIPFQAEITVPKERFSMIDDSLSEKPSMMKESYKLLHDVPVCVDLYENKLIGIIGGENYGGCCAVVQNLIAQIAASNCYTDVKMAFAYNANGDEDGDMWNFVRWLPHVWSEDGKVRYVGANRAEASDVFYDIMQILRFRAQEAEEHRNRTVFPKPYYILFVKDPELLEGELLSKYIYDAEVNYGITTVLLAKSYDELPNECEYIIENTSNYQGMYRVMDGEDDRVAIKYDMISRDRLEEFARRLSAIRVKEEENGGDIPNVLTFFDMYGVNRPEELNVLDRWRKNRTYESLKALVGQKAGGIDCYLDVHEKYHGPHGLVAGTTGSGKSETLQTYILSLALNFSPEDVGFLLIDYKGGGMANLFDGLPHMIGQISNLSGNQVRRAMVSIKSENQRRQRIFNEHGVNNINLYTRLYKNNEANIPVPHMFIIIDEFAELKREEPEFMRELISVAQVGRSLGVHLILATQKPSGTVDENIWSNSKFRLCLRVQDRQDSMDMLHKADAAYITQAGRCYMQVGNDELYELFQSAWSGAVYDENGIVQSDIARIISNNGRTALSGSHAQVKHKEKLRNLWILQLITCTNAALQKIGIADIKVCREDKLLCEELVEAFFLEAAARGIEYPRSEYNERRMEDFIMVYAELVGEEACAENALPAEISRRAAEMRKKLPESRDKTQLDAVVSYLAKTAEENGYIYNLQLWLPLLPRDLYLNELPGYKARAFDGSRWPEAAKSFTLNVPVGLYDDPENQVQNPLLIDIADGGNLAVLGMTMTGKSTFLASYIYAVTGRYTPDVVNLYILDYSSKMLGAFADMPHVGGIMFEEDVEKVSKFFTFMDSVLQERKKLLQGGNYSQYVHVNGYAIPAIVIIIDNFAAFRTRTENKYDDYLQSFLKEATAYGIFMAVSAGGFSTSEVPGRMTDMFRNVVALEMADKFAYSEVLRVMHLEVFPEENVKGRGLARIGETVLEFQTAQCAKAADDFARGELIRKRCREFTAAWAGKRARQIPVIPEEPTWKLFGELEEVKHMTAEGVRIPVGYDKATASVYGINLQVTYAYIISGKARTGKTNMLRILMRSASLMGGQVTVIDFSGELEALASEISAEYIGNAQALFAFFSALLPDFKERNTFKKECLARGCTDSEIFAEMQKFNKRFLMIGDLPEFINRVKHPGEGIEDMSGFVGNLLDKGALHNVFWFAALNQDNASDVIGTDIYTLYTREKNGIHFGGNVAGQRILPFDYVSYADQSKKLPTGTGMLPANDDAVKTVIVPLYRKD